MKDPHVGNASSCIFLFSVSAVHSNIAHFSWGMKVNLGSWLHYPAIDVINILEALLLMHKECLGCCAAGSPEDGTLIPLGQDPIIPFNISNYRSVDITFHTRIYSNSSFPEITGMPLNQLQNAEAVSYSLSGIAAQTLWVVEKLSLTCILSSTRLLSFRFCLD